MKLFQEKSDSFLKNQLLQVFPSLGFGHEVMIS